MFFALWARASLLLHAALVTAAGCALLLPRGRAESVHGLVSALLMIEVVTSLFIRWPLARRRLQDVPAAVLAGQAPRMTLLQRCAYAAAFAALARMTFF